MTSLRKRVSSYFRQLSFHNEPRERKTNINENIFVTKYLTGQIKLREGPSVLYGKSSNDLPNFELGDYSTGVDTVLGCSTGPNEGLTTIKRIEKHLSVTDLDIDFIDTQEETAEIRHRSPLRTKRPLDNTNMVIKVAGQEYKVSNRKSRSLGSLTDLTVNTSSKTPDEQSQPPTNNNVPFVENKRTSKCCDDDKVPGNKSSPVNKCRNLSKSKSESNPFEHRKKGKIIRLAERPQAQETQTDYSSPISRLKDTSAIPKQWNRKTDLVYGISDSLYDTNQVTKCKNGNPIADCFGIIARNDSAILALADGVNWGEKACIAAKSAVHGCMHYLNKTIFDDTSLFDYDSSHKSENPHSTAKQNAPIITTCTLPKNNNEPETNENRISNTTEVFVSLLRAFNCAHNSILENQGMLTTLTVAVVLPLKAMNCRKTKNEESQEVGRHVEKTLSDVEKDSVGTNEGSCEYRKYICCVCNVGDTLAYVYSAKYGVRELTKGSHDVYCNRDMRDALGALGPVDGINPELNNLTLSITTLDAGDIVMIASDGLTDNYDPTVCKFTVNLATNESSKAHSKSGQGISTTKEKQHTRTTSAPIRDSRNIRERKISTSSTSSRNKEPSTPKLNPSNVSRLAKEQAPTTPVVSKPEKDNKTVPKEPKTGCDVTDNPLVAQFMVDNALSKANENEAVSNHKQRSVVEKSKRVTLNADLSERKKLIPLSKSSSASAGVFKSKTATSIPEQNSRYGFLRSRTSIELHSPAKLINRNEDGLPFVTPLQKYELTLLLMEDILKRGISGKEKQCNTAKILCENLLKYTVSITAAKRHTLEDLDLYFDNKNDILVEISQREKKLRRKRCLEKVQNLPGKLDHVSVVAWNVGNKIFNQQQI